MINLYNQVPSVYTSASRDFQYLSWLFNIVLNSVKHNVDGLYNLPNSGSDPKLTELLAMTLGFKVKRNYDETQLQALVSILPTVLKYKGTKKAVEMAARALVKATGSLGEANVEIEGTNVEVTLPKDLIDVTLFLDLLDYILPAGMTCRIARKNEKTKKVNDILIKHSDTLSLIVADDLKPVHGTGDFNGLSSLYNLDSASLILGKAFIVDNSKPKSVNITVHDRQLVSPIPSMLWTLEASKAGYRLKQDTYYLKHELVIVDNIVVPSVNLVSDMDKATVWSITSTSKRSTEASSLDTADVAYNIMTIDQSNNTEYCLAYNHETEQFCTSILGERRSKGDVFELYLYKEDVQETEHEDGTVTSTTIYTSLQLPPLPEVENSVADTISVCVVAQGAPDFTSNIKKFDNNLVLNAGLLSNTVIPVLADSRIVEVDSDANTDLLYSEEKSTDGSLITEPLTAADGVQLRAKKLIQEL